MAYLRNKSSNDYEIETLRSELNQLKSEMKELKELMSIKCSFLDFKAFKFIEEQKEIEDRRTLEGLRIQSMFHSTRTTIEEYPF